MENKIQESMKGNDLTGAVYKNKGFLVKKSVNDDGETQYMLCLFVIRYPFENDGSIGYNWYHIKEKDIKEEDISWRHYKIKSTYKSDESLSVGTIVKVGDYFGVISREYTDNSFEVELFKKEAAAVHCSPSELIIPFESRCLIGIFDDLEKRKGVKRENSSPLERQTVLNAIQDLNVMLREKLEEIKKKYVEMHKSEDTPYTNRERIAISAERKGISAMYSIFMNFCEKKFGFTEKQIWGKSGYDKDRTKTNKK